MNILEILVDSEHHLAPSTTTFLGTFLGSGSWLYGIVSSDQLSAYGGVLVIGFGAGLGIYQRWRETRRGQDTADAEAERAQRVKDMEVEAANWEHRYSKELAEHAQTQRRLVMLEDDFRRCRTELERFHVLYQEALNQRWMIQTTPPNPAVPPSPAVDLRPDFPARHPRHPISPSSSTNTTTGTRGTVTAPIPGDAPPARTDAASANSQPTTTPPPADASSDSPSRP
ncbi:MAG: hypothetical protein AB7G11_02585 [Phycisphaerales bacterium]